MNELLNTDQLNLLVRALRQKSFHFIIVGYDHPDIYTEMSVWLHEHLPDRQIRQLSVSGKSFQEIRNLLIEADHDVVIIPDFDWFFKADNAGICVAFNQHRDFFARRKMTLLCFIQSLNFRLLPLKMPDLWSLRSLELEFTQFQQAESGVSASELGEIRKLYAEHPDNLLFKHELAVSYSKLGDNYFFVGNIDYALTLYEQSDKLMKELHKDFPDNLFFKYGVATSCEKLGDTHAKLAHNDTALSYFEQSTQVRKELHEMSPNDISLQNGLAISYEKLGQIHSDLGNPDKAFLFCEHSARLSGSIE